MSHGIGPEQSDDLGGVRAPTSIGGGGGSHESSFAFPLP